MENKNKFNLFHIDTAKIEEIDLLNASDFAPATEQEKEDMIENRASVSYWKDAARRFRKNRVSMAALFLFIAIFVFSFLGPLFIPYDYANQYRNNVKLGPMEYSQKEEYVRTVLKENEYAYATALIPGSLNALSANTTYQFNIGGKTYNFYNESLLGDVIITFNKNDT